MILMDIWVKKKKKVTLFKGFLSELNFFYVFGRALTRGIHHHLTEVCSENLHIRWSQTNVYETVLNLKCDFRVEEEAQSTVGPGEELEMKAQLSDSAVTGTLMKNKSECKERNGEWPKLDSELCWQYRWWWWCLSGGTTHAASAPEPPLMSKTNEEEDGEGEDTKVPLDLIIQVKWLISFSHSTFQAVLG